MEEIINRPTINNADVVAADGIDKNNGEKKTAESEEAPEAEEEDEDNDTETDTEEETSDADAKDNDK